MKTNHEGIKVPDSGLEDAVADLQMRLTYQEDEIKHLNLTLDRQRSELDAFKRELERLRKLMNAMAPAQLESVEDERPPHY